MGTVTRLRKPGLPETFATHPDADGLIDEFDLRVSRNSRLRAKVLLFDSLTSFRAFFAKALDRPAPDALAAVTSLSLDWHDADGVYSHTECDGRYFCVVGLVRGHLGTEYVMHECVHIAYCYARRVRGMAADAKVHDFDEEHIAYPAGRAARAIVQWLYKRGHYPSETRVEEAA